MLRHRHLKPTRGTPKTATALLCLAACSLRDDGEQDAFNAAYINAAAAAVGVGAVPQSLEHSSWAAALKPLALGRAQGER